jgi:hypothetical protein
LLLSLKYSFLNNWLSQLPNFSNLPKFTILASSLVLHVLSNSWNAKNNILWQQFWWTLVCLFLMPNINNCPSLKTCTITCFENKVLI